MNYDPIAHATAAAERIIAFYPNLDASDPRVFTAGMVELLADYSPSIIDRSPSVRRGFPGLFKWPPKIAEMREVLDNWAEEERLDNERDERWRRPGLPVPDDYHMPPPRANATRSALCARYGLRDIPPGWDAVDVSRAAAKYGDRLPEIVEQMLTNRVEAPKSVFGEVVEKARDAMDRYRAA